LASGPTNQIRAGKTAKPLGLAVPLDALAISDEVMMREANNCCIATDIGSGHDLALPDPGFTETR
jgi:hypothetical protein